MKSESLSSPDSLDASALNSVEGGLQVVGRRLLCILEACRRLLGPHRQQIIESCFKKRSQGGSLLLWKKRTRWGQIQMRSSSWKIAPLAHPWWWPCKNTSSFTQTTLYRIKSILPIPHRYTDRQRPQMLCLIMTRNRMLRTTPLRYSLTKSIDVWDSATGECLGWCMDVMA